MNNLKLDFLNKTYFGSTVEDINLEETRDYLKDDLISSMCSVIHLNILNFIMKKDGYNVTLEDLRNLCINGLILNIRKIIKRERKKKDGKIEYCTGEVGGCTGGDFIDDLCSLTENDLRCYKDVKLPIAVIFGNDSLDFSDDRFMKLCASAERFRDKGYYNKVLKHNEGVALHKDRFPEKRTIISRYIQDCDSPFDDGKKIKSIVTTYKSNLDVNLLLITECLNDFSGVLIDYEKLMYEFGVEFVNPPRSNICEYIKETIGIYNCEVFDKDISIIVTTIIKKLRPTIEACGWDISDD